MAILQSFVGIITLVFELLEVFLIVDNYIVCVWGGGGGGAVTMHDLNKSIRLDKNKQVEIPSKRVILFLYEICKRSNSKEILEGYSIHCQL